jgi:hypothetical protein
MAVSNPTRVTVVHTVYLRGVDVFRLMEVYMSMRRDGLQMTREILHLVLRGSSSTDERLLQLLNDSKTCLSVTNDVARIANGVLEKVGPQLVSGNLELVEEWLSGASEILDIMGKESVLKLFRLANALPHITVLVK